jgi:hypothetical protein
MPVVRVSVDQHVCLWFDANQWIQDIVYIGALQTAPTADCVISRAALLCAGCQTVFGMLPWLAIAATHGRMHPPPPTLRAFGGGSGLLAFASSPAAQRCSFGEPEYEQDETATMVVAESTASEPPQTTTAQTTTAHSAWAALFPTVSRHMA